MTLYKYRDSYSPGDGVVVDGCNFHRRRHVVLARPLRLSPVGPVHLPLSVEGGPPVSQVTYSTLAAITKGNSRTAQSKRARGTTMDGLTTRTRMCGLQRRLARSGSFLRSLG